jgi:hypothetical protein
VPEKEKSMKKSAQKPESKKLTLHRETVKLIAGDDLTAVAGGWSGWSYTWASGTRPTCFE